ncbi:hypothetical protein F4821DRAFT_48967 [Hypoxylon rubiginosum]|uniref:Uncharacterized protein n=1 Tax=Hypoxylon rubiginosum TaxID=110542 RepID=A0ACC0CK55_9PEZI|nr:hypothetical protein F4821DRAFT_48967 [Hypoxylon rubiginosum]
MSLDKGYWVTPSHTIAAGVGLSVLDIVAVSLRFVARRKQRQPLKADDWFMVPATLFTLGIGIAMVYGASKTALAHPLVVPSELNGSFVDLQSEQISVEGAIQWAYTLMLPLALGCTKVSFLFFYRRLFVVNKRSSNNVFLIGMIMFVFLWMVGFFLTFLFQCRLNFWALWTSPTAIAEHCTSDTPINLAFTITDLITDVAILVIPIPIIWRLNLSLSRKMSITAVFLFGAITVAASLTRVVLTARIFVEAFTADADPILIVTAFIYWGMIETGIAVFTACLPTVWFFFRGWSWDPVVKVARSIMESSASSIRLLKTKTSSINVADGDSLNAEVEKAQFSTTPSGRSVAGPRSS